jgi:hypothetical protein
MMRSMLRLTTRETYRRPGLRILLRIAAVTLPVIVVAWAATAAAVVWKRVRPDGTEEFTNLKPSSKDWVPVKGTSGGPARSAGSAPPAAAAASSTSEPAPAASPSGNNRPARGSSAAPAIMAGPSGGAGSTVWGRENEDGTVEFTNLKPTGKSWKALFRTGPGKAAAIRGPSDLVPPRDTSVSRFSRYDRHIRDQQPFFGIPQALVRAVIKVESDYDPRVVSSAGCVGLMQLAPETARSMGVTDIWDPRQNIMGGSRYLQVLARRFCRTPARSATGFVCATEELVRVIAGYHAGPGAVDKYGGMPPYETTRAYVASVLTRYEEFRHKEGAAAATVALGTAPAPTAKATGKP